MNTAGETRKWRAERETPEQRDHRLAVSKQWKAANRAAVKAYRASYYLKEKGLIDKATYNKEGFGVKRPHCIKCSKETKNRVTKICWNCTYSTRHRIRIACCVCKVKMTSKPNAICASCAYVRAAKDRKNRSRERGKEKTATRNRRNYHTDERFRMLTILRTRLHQALMHRSIHSLAIKRIAGCTTADLVAHLESQFKPGMSWSNYGQWHVDHKKPCAFFDILDAQQQRQCFHYSNLQPLWALDNMRKGATNHQDRGEQGQCL
jgi:hypothetical protein